MKHEVKDNKDVIYKGEIYKAVNGFVELPEKVETEDIKPVEEKVEVQTRRSK